MFNHPIRKRIATGFSANVAGQGINVLQQILMVPLYTSIWGLPLYGEWILLSTIPVYLAMCDLGLCRAMATKLALLSGAGRRAESNQLINTSFAAVIPICVILALSAPFVCAWVPFYKLLNLRHLTEYEAKWTLTFLIWGVAAQVIHKAFSVLFNCEGRYARGSVLFNLLKAFEVGACIVVLACHRSPAELAFTIAAMHVLCAAVTAIAVRAAFPWIRVGVQFVDWSCIHDLIWPSIGCLIFPLAIAVNLQGMILAVGLLFGPELVVVFATTRLITRSILQWGEAMKNTIRPELSLAFGGQNLALAAKLFRKACCASLWSSLFWAVLLSPFAAVLFRFLTHGKAQFDPLLYASLMLTVVLNSFWIMGAVVLDATNRTFQFSITYCAVSIFSVVLSLVVMNYFGFRSAAIGTVAGDFIMLWIVFEKSLGLVKDRIGMFSKFILSPFNLWAGSPAE